MSVECRMFIGLTLEFAKDLKYEDFRKCEEFTKKHPELDEYEYSENEKEGKLLLIGDGMNGQFLRLIKVDKLIEGGSMGDANEFVELPMPGRFNPEVTNKMAALYEEYTRKPLNPKDYKYAMWSQWY